MYTLLKILALFALCVSQPAFGWELRVEDKGEKLAPKDLRNSPIPELFGEPELWGFWGSENFEKMVERELGIYPELAQQLRPLLKTYDQLTPAERVRVDIGYLTQPAEKQHLRFAFVPTRLRDSMPRPVLEEVYQGMSTLSSNPGQLPSLKFSSPEAAKDYLRKFGVPEGSMEEFTREMFVMDGKVSLYFPAGLKPYVPEKMMADLRSPERWLGSNQRRVDARILIREGDDLAEIARTYAAGRDPALLERYLKKVMERSRKKSISLSLQNLLAWNRPPEEKPVEVPLKNLMTKFGRKSLDTYAGEHGPNCFNSGLCMNDGPRVNLHYVDVAELTERLANDYDKITTGHSQVNDIWAYINEKNEVTHVASYMGQGVNQKNEKVSLLFTKNGLSNRSPYVLQTSDVVDNLYGNRIVVFRPKAGLGIPAKSGCPQAFANVLK